MRALATMLAGVLLATVLGSASGQQPDSSRKAAKAAARAAKEAGDSRREPHGPAPLFASETPLELTVVMNIRDIRRDRGKDVSWHAATVRYRDSAGVEASVPTRVRTRGIWRLKNCDFPPLRLNFAKDSVRGTPFARLDRPKLVTHCRDRDDYERNLLRELLAYRIYAAVTDISHRARLVHVTYVDSATAKPVVTRHGIITEDAGEIADRMGFFPIDVQGAGPEDTNAYQMTLFSLFQYLIGNTDWSITALHNVELFGRDTLVLPVPYDFDFSGLVNAGYATPDPQLHIAHVRQRVYRGYCAPPAVVREAATLLAGRRDAIMKLVDDSIGVVLRERDRRDVTDYLNAAWKDLGEPERAAALVARECLRGR